MQLGVSLLVWPVSLATFVVLGVRCYKKKILQESIPLLATQFNSALIWGCLSAVQVGHFNLLINGTPILKGDHYPLSRFMIPDFLMFMIYLEPLNLFLYTWRFMRKLEQEEKNSIIKIFTSGSHAFRLWSCPLPLYAS